MDEWYDAAGAGFLWVLMLPGVLPLLAAGALIVGLRRAGRARRPALYRFGVITAAVGIVCFALIPVYARYIHARRVDAEWFWQALGLLVPFVVLGIGLRSIAAARSSEP